jgi:hypothetical protein
MHIDSVRELKAKCLKRHVRPLAAKPLALAALAIGARAMAKVDPIQRTMALGIVRKGEKDFRLAVRIQSLALAGSPQLAAIRKWAKDEVDVRYVGRIVKRAVAWHQSRQRPLLIGVSVGHYRITAGTLGCFVKTRQGGGIRLLSNNHVLADENAGRRGDAIIQPGQFDQGRRGRDTVGKLDRFVRLKRSRPNDVDAALATVLKEIQCDQTTLRDSGALRGVATAPLDIGEEVCKVGRTTGRTRGGVTAFELDNVVVGYDLGNLRFDNQIEIEGADAGPFSQGGDSGSLIVNRGRQAVALLFAGGDQGGANGKGLTYANPIDRVLGELGVDLLC